MRNYQYKPQKWIKIVNVFHPGFARAMKHAQDSARVQGETIKSNRTRDER